jgi:hypothetical protein
MIGELQIIVVYVMKYLPSVALQNCQRIVAIESSGEKGLQAIKEVSFSLQSAINSSGPRVGSDSLGLP